jgi:hypothetical protein
VTDGLEAKLREWFFAFEAERKANEENDDEQKDVQLVEYRRLISQSTDSEESINARLDFFEKRFFDAAPDIEPKDPQRGFSHETAPCHFFAATTASASLSSAATA